MPWQHCLSSWAQAKSFCRGHLELTGESTPCHRDILEGNGALCNPPGSLPWQPFLIPIFQGSAYDLSCYLHSLVDAFHTSFNVILYPHSPTPISCLQAPNVRTADFMNSWLHRLLIHLFFFSNVDTFSFIIYFKQWATSSVSWVLPGLQGFASGDRCWLWGRVLDKEEQSAEASGPPPPLGEAGAFCPQFANAAAVLKLILLTE